MVHLVRWTLLGGVYLEDRLSADSELLMAEPPPLAHGNDAACQVLVVPALFEAKGELARFV